MIAHELHLGYHNLFYSFPPSQIIQLFLFGWETSCPYQELITAEKNDDMDPEQKKFGKRIKVWDEFFGDRGKNKYRAIRFLIIQFVVYSSTEKIRTQAVLQEAFEAGKMTERKFLDFCELLGLEK